MNLLPFTRRRTLRKSTTGGRRSASPSAMPITAANRARLSADTPVFARPDGAFSATSNTSTGSPKSLASVGGAAGLRGDSAENHAADLPLAQLLADGGDRAANFAGQRPRPAGDFARIGQPHRPHQHDLVAHEHGEIGFVGEPIDHQRDVARAGAEPARDERRGRGRPQRDSIRLDADRLAQLPHFGDAAGRERGGEHLVRRRGVARERNVVERRLGTERRKLALGLESHELGQFVRRGRGERQQHHLHLIAADADERRRIRRTPRRRSPRRAARRSRAALSAVPSADASDAVQAPTTDDPVGPACTKQRTGFEAIPINGENAGHGSGQDCRMRESD